MRKSLFTAGLGFAVGYVLGSKAGRERYEQLREAGQAAVTTGKVSAGVAQATATATARAGTLTRKAVAKVRGDREITLPDAPVFTDGPQPPAETSR